MIEAAVTCYMCEAPKTSVEHVPPKCLFPKSKDLPVGADLRKQLITVPSCDGHNSEKSCDDEYLMYALTFGIQNNETARRQVNTKITRAIAANGSLARSLAKHHITVGIRDLLTTEKYNTIALCIDASRVHRALDQIGRALHFHHFKSKWLGQIQVIPLFLLSLEGDAPQIFNSHIENMGRLVEELLSGVPSHGANPEIFAYRAKNLDTGSGGSLSTVMLLSFFEGSKVILLFKSDV